MSRRGVIVCVVFALTAMVAHGAEPWIFTSDSERQQAEKTWDSWQDAYVFARESLTSGKPDLAKAALALKLAIAKNDDSRKTELTLVPRKGGSSYFPYYWLALALARQGALDDASSCLARENRSLIDSLRSELGDAAGTLEKDLGAASQARQASNRIRALAAALEGQGATRLLAEESRQLASAVAARSGELTPKLEAMGTGRVAASIDAARIEAEQSLARIYRLEIEARRDLAAELSSEAWKAVNGSAGAQAADRVCVWNAGRLDESEKQWRDCAAAFDARLQEAVRSVCDRISRSLSDLDRLEGATRAWSEIAGKTPPAFPVRTAKPKACGGALSLTRTELGSLPATLATVEKAYGSATAMRDAARDEARKAIVAIERRAPGLPSGCAEALGATPQKRKIDAALRLFATAGKEDTPPAGLLEAVGGFDRDIAAVLEGVARGSQRLLSSPPPTAKDENLAVLRTALEAFSPQSATSATLKTLCEAARPLAGASELAKESLSERRTVARAILTVARGLRLAADEAPCVAEALAAVEKNSDEATIVDAEGCAAQVSSVAEALGATLADAPSRYQSAATIAERFAARFGDAAGQSAEIRESTVAAARELGSRLSELASFVKEGPSGASDLRVRVRELRLEAGSEKFWQRSVEDAAKVSDEDGRSLAFMVRAALAGREARGLEAAAAKPLAARLAGWHANLAVAEALELAAAGRLDEAITALSEARDADDVVHAARSSALMEASLALLLEWRARAEPASSRSAEVLRVQARERLSQAFELDAELSLPASIFPEWIRETWRGLRGARP